MTAGTSKIAVGVSSCLLGAKVRFDGGHKRDDFVTDLLGRFFAFTAVCPEFEMGLGAPRESLRLTGDPAAPRLVGNKTGADRSDAMHRWAAARLRRPDLQALRGYILKKDSPSCGLERVRVYNASGMPEKKGAGLFAADLGRAFPMLPVEDEGRLHDPVLRENFVERVFAYDRWLRLREERLTPKRLLDFHTAEKLSVMAHSPVAYRELGRLIAGAGKAQPNALADAYGERWMAALKLRATRGKHANVLQHAQGYFKRAIDEADKHELNEVIESYRVGRVPLAVPLTLIKHHLRRHPHAWLLAQRYFHPYPEELALRNDV